MLKRPLWGNLLVTYVRHDILEVGEGGRDEEAERTIESRFCIAGQAGLWLLLSTSRKLVRRTARASTPHHRHDINLKSNINRAQCASSAIKRAQ